MRNNVMRAVIALCLGVLPGASWAGVSEDAFLMRSTNDLVELCTAAPSDPMGTAALNFCHGFGVGVYRVLEEMDMARGTHLFCMPARLPTRNEALASFIRWAKSNPDALRTPAQDGIAMFLSKQYPCASKQ
jgi:hypothetical protein